MWSTPANRIAALTTSVGSAIRRLSWARRKSGKPLKILDLIRPIPILLNQPRLAPAAASANSSPSSRTEILPAASLQGAADPRDFRNCPGLAFVVQPSLFKAAAFQLMYEKNWKNRRAKMRTWRYATYYLEQHCPRGMGEPCGQVWGCLRKLQSFSVTSGLKVCSILQAFSSSKSRSSPKVS